MEFYLLFVHHDKGWNADSVHYIYEDACARACKVTECAKKHLEFGCSDFKKKES